ARSSRTTCAGAWSCSRRPARTTWAACRWGSATAGWGGPRPWPPTPPSGPAGPGSARPSGRAGWTPCTWGRGPARCSTGSAATAASLVLAAAARRPAWAVAVLGPYTAANVVASLAAARRDPVALPALPAAYACIHYGYGLGFLAGVWKWRRQFGRRRAARPAA